MKSSNRDSSYRFWVLSPLLTLCNTWISLGPLPSWGALGIVLFGLIPLCFFLSRSGVSTGKKDTVVQNEFFSGIKPLWIWGLLAAAWVLRLWKIGDQATWPTGDEALTGLTAIDWSHHWDGRIFYTAGQDPPTLFWLTGLFFQFCHNPALNLWLPSALVSCLSGAVGYAAAKRISQGLFLSSLLPMGFQSLAPSIGRKRPAACFTTLWVTITLLFLGGVKAANILGQPFGGMASK